MNIKSLRWRFPYKLNDISKMCILCLAHKQLLLYFKDFFLVFGFLRFEYDMARYKLFGVYPSYVSWTAWIHGLVSVISCGKFSAIVTSIIFFSAPFSLSFSSDIPIMCMLYLLQLSHSLWILCSFFFSLHFSFGRFLLAYLSVHWFLACPWTVYLWAHQRHSSFLL